MHLIGSAAFSAIAIVGAIVLPLIGVGAIEASTTADHTVDHLLFLHLLGAVGSSVATALAELAALVNFEGTESLEDASREVVRVARLGSGGSTGTFTLWDGVELRW